MLSGPGHTKSRWQINLVKRKLADRPVSARDLSSHAMQIERGGLVFTLRPCTKSSVSFQVCIEALGALRKAIVKLRAGTAPSQGADHLINRAWQGATNSSRQEDAGLPTTGAG